LLGVVLIRRRRSRFSRNLGNSFRGWLWKTIDRFSEGRAKKADEAGEIVEPIDVDPTDVDPEEGGKGAHVRDDE
jgi:hypothetical protein